MKRVIVVMMSLLLTACGLGTSGGFVPKVEPKHGIDLSGLKISVGSKNFTEGVILGKMAVILLNSTGAEVQDLTSIPGSTSARQAQLNGDVDMEFDYTGTAWITYLGETEPIPDEQAQYEAVRDRDKKLHDLIWLQPAPMNNTYALAVTRETSEEYGITSLEQMKDLPEPSYCVDAEFSARNDGLDPLLETYGAGGERSIMDPGAIYQGVAGGTCLMGEVFQTDGRIPALDLVVLDDPKNFFPHYNMAAVVRGEVLREYPEIEDLFAPVTEHLTNEKMQQLNARVDVEGDDPAQVALDYLVDLGVVAQSTRR